MYFLRIPCLLLCCLCLSACLPTMRTLRPALHGTVTDFISKEPLEGVLLTDVSNASSGDETLSDEKGYYTMSGRYTLGYNILGGEGYSLEYRVEFRKEGYLPFIELAHGGFGSGQGMRETEMNPRMIRKDHPAAVALVQFLNSSELPEEETAAACLHLLTTLQQAGMTRDDVQYLLDVHQTSRFLPINFMCRRQLEETGLF